jgi:hypothetical protein
MTHTNMSVMARVSCPYELMWYNPMKVRLHSLRFRRTVERWHADDLLVRGTFNMNSFDSTSRTTFWIQEFTGWKISHCPISYHACHIVVAAHEL